MLRGRARRIQTTEEERRLEASRRTPEAVRGGRTVGGVSAALFPGTRELAVPRGATFEGKHSGLETCCEGRPRSTVRPTVLTTARHARLGRRLYASVFRSVREVPRALE